MEKKERQSIKHNSLGVSLGKSNQRRKEQRRQTRRKQIQQHGKSEFKENNGQPLSIFNKLKSNENDDKSQGLPQHLVYGSHAWHEYKNRGLKPSEQKHVQSSEKVSSNDRNNQFGMFPPQPKHIDYKKNVVKAVELKPDQKFLQRQLKGIRPSDKSIPLPKAEAPTQTFESHVYESFLPLLKGKNVENHQHQMYRHMPQQIFDTYMKLLHKNRLEIVDKLDFQSKQFTDLPTGLQKVLFAYKHNVERVRRKEELRKKNVFANKVTISKVTKCKEEEMSNE